MLNYLSKRRQETYIKSSYQIKTHSFCMECDWCGLTQVKYSVLNHSIPSCSICHLEYNMVDRTIYEQLSFKIYYLFELYKFKLKLFFFRVCS